MIDKDLLNRVSVYTANSEPLSVELTKELASNYTSLIEQNAELYKKLAKLTVAVLEKEKVFVCNKGEVK